MAFLLKKKKKSSNYCSLNDNCYHSDDNDSNDSALQQQQIEQDNVFVQSPQQPQVVFTADNTADRVSIHNSSSSSSSVEKTTIQYSPSFLSHKTLQTAPSSTVTSLNSNTNMLVKPPLISRGTSAGSNASSVAMNHYRQRHNLFSPTTPCNGSSFDQQELQQRHAQHSQQHSQQRYTQDQESCEPDSMMKSTAAKATDATISSSTTNSTVCNTTYNDADISNSTGTSYANNSAAENSAAADWHQTTTTRQSLHTTAQHFDDEHVLPSSCVDRQPHLLQNTNLSSSSEDIPPIQSKASTGGPVDVDDYYYLKQTKKCQTGGDSTIPILLQQLEQIIASTSFEVEEDLDGKLRATTKDNDNNKVHGDDRKQQVIKSHCGALTAADSYDADSYYHIDRDYSYYYANDLSSSNVISQDDYEYCFCENDEDGCLEEDDDRILTGYMEGFEPATITDC